MIKFGQLLPIPVSPVDSLIKIGVRTEKAGFDSIWAADHLLMIPTGIVPNVWPILAVIASQTGKIEIGTCVSDPHRLHPAVCAQMLATLDQISNGRVILGLGAGEAMNVEQFGIPWNKPVARMVEFTKIVRSLWLKDKVDYSGEFWKLKNAFLQIKPIRNPVPIYFAANGRRTRQITGEIADGWLPTPRSPELYRKHLKEIKEAATKAGRTLDKFEPGLYVYAAVAEKYEDAMNQLRKIRSQIAFSPKMVTEAYNVNIPSRFSENLYSEILVTDENIKLYEEFGNYIPDEVIEDFSIVGTPGDCANKVEEFVKAGVRHFVLINMGPNPKFVLDVFSNKIIPSYREEKK
ncbi:MAG: LLM class flavin-dependent oxidoreductase [Archaeoglobaceae archaeon]|nr:LLM class flavin-dependent oxidoreductase [Archaeoglobaceae archaeon]MDW7990413.1 LLM class flavin-dependent oxidoreductase [Archaeoglobaceae archaeon]